MANKKLLFAANRIAVGNKPDVQGTDKQGALFARVPKTAALCHRSQCGMEAVTPCFRRSTTHTLYNCSWCCHSVCSFDRRQTSDHYTRLCKGRRRDADEEPVAYHAMPKEAASWYQI